MGQGYGKLNRRRSTGSWQWMLIGFLPGILCGGSLLFGLLITGALDNFTGANATPMVITQEVRVVEQITTTPAPAQATATPVVITATPQPTVEAGESQISLPTATQVTAQQGVQEPAGQQGSVEEQVAPTQAPPGGFAPTSTPPPATPEEAAVPAQLASLISPMLTVSTEPVNFSMGTTVGEVLQAVDFCVNVNEGSCLERYGEDSYPQINIQLSPYRIEQREVSFRQYLAFLNYLQQQGVSHTNGCGGFACIQTQNENPNAPITFDGANYNTLSSLLDYPAYGVTWYGAQTYCETIGGRLPTEAEWEYAAKGPDGFIYPWGNQWTPDFAQTRLPDTTDAAPLPVDSFAGVTSPFGTWNQAGNIAEWVQDWYGTNYYQTLSNQVDAAGEPALNPSGPPSGTEKVLRGGSFDALPFFARTVHRQSWSPAVGADGSYPNWVGFRCADELAPQATTSGGVDPASLGVPAQDAEPTLEAQPGLPTTEANAETTDSPEAQQDSQTGSGERG